MIEDNQAKARHNLRIAKGNKNVHEAIDKVVEAVHAVVDSIEIIEANLPQTRHHPEGGEL